jgi:hypothetical protein
MNYPTFSTILNRAMKESPETGIQNSLQLAKKIGVSPSTVTRHASGDKLPTPESFELMVAAFPERHRAPLILAYMQDSLPRSLRGRVHAEVGPEGIKEKSGDDISLISVLLKDFSTAHVEAVRYLVERAGSDPSVLRALTNVVRAMRGE